MNKQRPGDEYRWRNPSAREESDRRQLAGQVERIATQIRAGEDVKRIAILLQEAAVEAKRIEIAE